jgi:ABC-type antimicrobial peptide transport system permease subunit
VVRRRIAAVGAGLGIGALAGLALGRAMAGLLFGVGAGDPVSHAAAPAILFMVAALAAWLPARRAAAVNPAEVLRGD